MTPAGKGKAAEAPAATPAPASASEPEDGESDESARPGIKKSGISESSKDYATSIYKLIKEEEQQARVQTIFYELRAAGYGPNEAAAMAIDRAIGGGQQGAGGE